MRKQYIVAAIAILALTQAGCSKPDPYWENKKPLTNQEVAEAVQFCRSHKLRSLERDNHRGQAVEIECYGADHTSFN